MKSRLCIVMFLFASFACMGAKYHADTRGSEIHTPYRWTFADSAARVNQSVVAADTGKIAYQVSDSSVWSLKVASPKTWIQVGGHKFPKLLANSVEVTSTVTSTLSADSLSSRVYGDFASFPCTLYTTTGTLTGDSIGVIRINRIGKTVVLFFDGMIVNNTVGVITLSIKSSGAFYAYLNSLSLPNYAPLTVFNTYGEPAINARIQLSCCVNHILAIDFASSYDSFGLFGSGSWTY